jgi:hypothetical protein
MEIDTADEVAHRPSRRIRSSIRLISTIPTSTHRGCDTARMADVDIPGPVRPDPLPPDLAALYPEVALAGSLVPALRAELRRNGFDLPVLSPAASDGGTLEPPSAMTTGM